MKAMTIALLVLLSAASFLGLDGEGEIVAGKRANAVLLDADPLQDIRNVARINAVVLRGRLVGSDELLRLRLPVESAGQPAGTTGDPARD